MKNNIASYLLAGTASALLLSGAALAEGAAHTEIERQQWSFGGFAGQFDKAQLQRGFQIYKEVCSACHGMKRLSFRNLVQRGGPEFPEEAVKTLAAEWPNQIMDGPNDDGKMFERPAKLSDPIRGPYHNDREARAAQNGALPPDLTLIAKARGVERDPKWFVHPFLMLGDILHSYQEGGADYIHALLSGYVDAPKDFKVNDGMYYNAYFPGHQIGMPPPLSEGSVTYQDGTKPTLENYSADIAAYLAWAADPTLNQRKRIGWQVMLYLLVTTALLYFGKKRIWSNIKH